MTKKPFFSFVVPTFNRSADLQFAIYCILQQTFTNFEIIVSDNCSTDNTREIVKSFKDKRIRYFKNKENIGVLSNIKKAIVYAKGEYVFLHSDDDFIIYKDCLDDIFKNIKKYKTGYIRINYLARTPDRRRLFHYYGNTPYHKDYHLDPGNESENVIFFILKTDPGFITGMVFKNSLPREVTIIDSDPFWVIKILFYTVDKFGGYFISKPQIVASWSVWRVNKNNYNPIYSLIAGRLHSEPYFNFLKQKLTESSYESLLHIQLMEIYVRRFPAIKYYTGVSNMLRLSKRLRKLDKDISQSIYYWVYLILAIILPGFMLKILKDLAFQKYSKLSKTRETERAFEKLIELEEGFKNVKNHN